MKKMILLVIAILMFSGCAGQYDSHREEFQQSLENSVGKMAYDEALLKWGAPNSVTQGDKIFIARWGKQEKERVTTRSYGATVTRPVSYGWDLQLFFDKASKKLISWKYNEW
ncbi:MAG: hypothetical protein HY889_03040 [Deltaproteobacteria bacterium]|nr:hypothetical protein [Deltaproteobacteria bacterium]